MNTAFSFILVLGLLIFVHELGHFLFAKLFRIRVLKFSLGFGPKVFGRVIGETEYLISAFPLGGYVKMFGEHPDEQEMASVDRKASFAHKSVWERFFVVFAGPLFNLLFAVFLFFVIFLSMGLPESGDTTRIGQVTAESPAAAAGLMAGDEIIAINDRTAHSWLDVIESVKESRGEPIRLRVLRAEGSEFELLVIPQMDSAKNIFGEVTEERFMIGIVKADELIYTEVGPVRALTAAATQTWVFISLTLMGLFKIIQQVVPASELGGPILIAQLAGQQMQAGWVNLFYFMGLLSVNLGILNLLPIPVLDGGHLVFLSIEAIRRKPLGERPQIIAQQIGIALLGSLMIFVFYNDIMRIFGS
ncbi:MAG: RIP metalloprotease RseP [Desulfobulbaceae bacterium]|uniref:Zinc metalloprotease n=1 Tax=Candidatus Desulfatifera sulfidica TaxID=2841691 RepID=A0A8J6N537_9BACT|nr:RIP metalloprotease RseP [Candidatus Desulfatifera sulfidica]